jgi:hypothetical protein
MFGFTDSVIDVEYKPVISVDGLAQDGNLPGVMLAVISGMESKGVLLADVFKALMEIESDTDLALMLLDGALMVSRDVAVFVSNVNPLLKLMADDGLPDVFIEGLKSLQFENLPFSPINAERLIGYPSQKIVGLIPEFFAALSESVISAMLPGQIALLSGQQLSGLSSSQVAAFGNKIVALNEFAVNSLTVAHVSDLSTAHIGVLTPLQVASFAPEVLVSLGIDILSELSSDQVAELETNQVVALIVAGFISRLNTSLTSSQIKDLGELDGDLSSGVVFIINDFLRNDKFDALALVNESFDYKRLVVREVVQAFQNVMSVFDGRVPYDSLLLDDLMLLGFDGISADNKETSLTFRSKKHLPSCLKLGQCRHLQHSVRIHKSASEQALHF